MSSSSSSEATTGSTKFTSGSGCSGSHTGNSVSSTRTVCGPFKISVEISPMGLPLTNRSTLQA